MFAAFYLYYSKNTRIMKKILLLATITLAFIGCSSDDHEEVTNIVDGDGNIYTENTIGSQTWLKQDLKTTKYNDGSKIMHYEDRGTAGFYYNTNGNNLEKICPKGYRVPSLNDFDVLIDYFGGENLNAETIINKYVKVWNGNPNGAGDGITNEGSGLYWTNTTGKLGKHYFYFRTNDPGISVSNSSPSSEFHIKCIK